MSIFSDQRGPLSERAESRVLCLLDGPFVRAGDRSIPVPDGSKRVLAFVALHGGRADRQFLAGTLWPDGNDSRAAGNLRSALWRLRRADIDILESDKCSVWLRSGALIDVWALSEWAGRLIDGSATESDLQILGWDSRSADLLDGWYDDWVVFERERLRQRLMHALERLSARLARVGRFAEAVEAALTAVDIEPLRESAHRALIEAHLAEGNAGEARKAFAAYAARMELELGLPADPALRALLQDRPREGGAGGMVAAETESSTSRHRPGNGRALQVASCSEEAQWPT